MGIEQGILAGCGSVVSSEGEAEAEIKPGMVVGKPRYEVIDREQLCWRRVDVERLIGERNNAKRNRDFAGADQIETTLLIHPRVLIDFLNYNDFLAQGDRLIQSLRLRGVIQLASFHPEYQFAGTQPDDVENFTNRSPYPMLHLLREESITKVAGDEDELLAIPERNIKLLRSLGRDKMLQLLKSITQDRAT